MTRPGRPDPRGSWVNRTITRWWWVGLTVLGLWLLLPVFTRVAQAHGVAVAVVVVAAGWSAAAVAIAVAYHACHPSPKDR